MGGSFDTLCRYRYEGRGETYGPGSYTQPGSAAARNERARERARLAIEERRFVARFISAPSFFPRPNTRGSRPVEGERGGGEGGGENPVGFSDFVRRRSPRLVKSPLDAGKMAESIFAGVRLISMLPSRSLSAMFICTTLSKHLSAICQGANLV